MTNRVRTAFLRRLSEATTYINAMQKEVFLLRQTVNQVAPAINEVHEQLNLLMEEAKKAFIEEQELTEKQ